MLQLITWAMGITAVIRLWGDKTWLSIVTIVLMLSYEAHVDEQQHYNITGQYPDATAKRFKWSFILILGIFIYSFFI